MSVNTPEYSTQDWIRNPDLSSVEGEADKRKWVIEGDLVRLATVQEVDAQIEDYREEKLEQLAVSVEAFGEQYYSPQTEMRLKILRMAALPDRAALIDTVLVWEATLITDYMTRRAIVKAATTVADIEAVSLDFSNNAPSSVITVPDILEVTT